MKNHKMTNVFIHISMVITRQINIYNIKRAKMLLRNIN